MAKPRAAQPKERTERQSGPEKPAPVDLRSEPVTAMGLADVTLAAKLCFDSAAAIRGHADCADLDTPNAATFDAAEGLYEGNHVLHRGLGFPSLPINQLLLSVADPADCNADYGLGITAAHCHRTAWIYGKCVLGILHQWHVVGETLDGKVVTDHQQFRQKWGDIRHSLQALPRIEYAKFLAAFDREAARAQTLLRTSPAPKGEGNRVDDNAGRTPLVPSPVESQRLREFAHGLSGDEEKLVALLLARLDDAAKSDGLPLRASEADVTSLIHLQGEWKFNTSGEWKGLQTRLSKKLKAASIKWRVSSKGGAHLCRVEPFTEQVQPPPQKAPAKRVRTPR